MNRRRRCRRGRRRRRARASHPPHCASRRATPAARPASASSSAHAVTPRRRLVCSRQAGSPAPTSHSRATRRRDCCKSNKTGPSGMQLRCPGRPGVGGPIPCRCPRLASAAPAIVWAGWAPPPPIRRGRSFRVDSMPLCVPFSSASQPGPRLDRFLAGRLRQGVAPPRAPGEGGGDGGEVSHNLNGAVRHCLRCAPPPRLRRHARSGSRRPAGYEPGPCAPTLPAWQPANTNGS